MSFGGFGSNNNQSSGFGGFGSTNTTSSGSLFGGTTATAGSSGFGGFGSNQNKPAFGNTNTSGGGLFGSNTSTSGGFGASNTGFGGFGNSTNQQQQQQQQQQPQQGTGFGSSNTGGSIFSQNKPATTSLFGASNTGGGFGSSSTTANNPFGGGSSTFGGAKSNTGFGGFGSSNNTTGGFGANNSNNNAGTSSTPFQPFQEKDQTTNQNSHFQSITFQNPYQIKSFEELRCEDYAQGRRFGNTNGQAGTFGQSTGFGGSTSTGGGFGSTNANSGGGLFGNSNTNSGNTGFGGFGSNTTTAANNNNNQSSGFGGFGANKPATGSSLFGNQSSGTTTGGFGSTAGAGGGLFGNNNQNTSTGFGSSNTGTSLFGNTNNSNTGAFGGSNTGGSLFGTQNNQNNQNKTGSFGGFGSTNTNTGGSVFGNNQQQQSNTGSFASGGGLFGNNNQQNKPSGFGGFGASNTGGAFGANASTGTSLFGNQNSQPQQQGTSLFGNNQQSNTGGSLFGTNNNQQSNTGGSLFGNQNKPAGTSLFGNTNTTNTSGGLFGNTNSQTNTGTSLFGNQNNNTNTSGGLFGNRPAGGSLFGNTNTNQSTGNNLFGGMNTQNNNNNSSLFGNSQQNQQNTGSNLFGGSLNNSSNQQPTALTTSLTNSTYGNEQLFASLASPSPPIGPLATPLQNGKPVPRQRQSLLASSRIGSPSHSTPRAGGSFGRSGYGYANSLYGTPSSASSFAGSLTPGAQSLLRPSSSVGGMLGSRLSLSKSMSMSNLRNDQNRPSLLYSTPSAGSIRRLKIDRDLRTDLFGSPLATTPTPAASSIDSAKDADGPGQSGLRKTVSFDRSAEKETSASNGAPSIAEPTPQNALVRTEDEDDEPRAGGALATVAEESTPQPKNTDFSNSTGSGKSPANVDVGEYWMKPSLKQLKNMSRVQLQKIGKLEVGRDGAGRIQFNNPDLSSVNLDEILGTIVQLVPRHATVYPDLATKPPRGRGLNVPSNIWLENTWPRKNRDTPELRGDKISTQLLDRHRKRLQRIADTEFVDFDPHTGVWEFKVQHFTTYGLDDEDDESEHISQMDVEHEQHESSPLSEPPQTPVDMVVEDEMTGQSFQTHTSSAPEDDTFQFKLEKGRLNRSKDSTRRSPLLPGGFGDEEEANDYLPEEVAGGQNLMSGALGGVDDPFLDPSVAAGAVQAPSPAAVERYYSGLMEDIPLAPQEPENDLDQEIPGSFKRDPPIPKSILKPSIAEPLTFDEAWEEQLQRTLSPKKQARPRQELKDIQTSALNNRDGDDSAYDSPFKKSVFAKSALDRSQFGQSHLATKYADKANVKGSVTKTKTDADAILGKSQAFKTSMDIMNSLWAQDGDSGHKRVGGKQVSHPNKRQRMLEIPEDEKASHNSLRPSFTFDGTILYEANTSATQPNDMVKAIEPVTGLHKDIRFVKFVPAHGLISHTLESQKRATVVDNQELVPKAITPKDVRFADLAACVSGSSYADVQEKTIWQLCSILFDQIPVVARQTLGEPLGDIDQHADRQRLNALQGFWATLVDTKVDEGVLRAKSAEEKAILFLCKGDVRSACDVLVAASDFKLATIVAQVPLATKAQEAMANQVRAWRDRNDWSEMSEPVRAIYSILAGIVDSVEGNDGRAEDQASAFTIAAKFKLDWKQSFGLRLFTGSWDSIASAVDAYSRALQAGTETVQPTADLLINGAVSGEHALMQLLRLTNPPNKDLILSLLSPAVLVGKPLGFRLSWQLATLMGSRGITDITSEIIDKVTIDFAAELETAGSFVYASWVLLHLSTPKYRQVAIQQLLNRNSARIPGPAEDGSAPTDFDVLVNDNGVPAFLIWTAKALCAASIDRDPARQVSYLLRAAETGDPSAIEDAHSVLCSSVGPTAVIEESYDTLSWILRLFNKAMQHGRAVGWEYGGQIYHDFCTLMQLGGKEKYGKQTEVLLQRLVKEFVLMDRERGAHYGLLEKVARIEMAKVVEQKINEMDGETAAAEKDDDEMLDHPQDGPGSLWTKYQSALGVRGQ